MNKEMEYVLDRRNQRGFQVSYIGPTIHRGDRVRIKDLRNNKTVIIPYDHEYNTAETAKIWLWMKHKIVCRDQCEYEKGWILLSNNFDKMIK